MLSITHGILSTNARIVKTNNEWVVVVAQLAERSPPTTVIRGSYLTIGKILYFFCLPFAKIRRKLSPLKIVATVIEFKPRCNKHFSLPSQDCKIHPDIRPSYGFKKLNFRNQLANSIQDILGIGKSGPSQTDLA